MRRAAGGADGRAAEAVREDVHGVAACGEVVDGVGADGREGEDGVRDGGAGDHEDGEAGVRGGRRGGPGPERAADTVGGGELGGVDRWRFGEGAVGGDGGGGGGRGVLERLERFEVVGCGVLGEVADEVGEG